MNIHVIVLYKKKSKICSTDAVFILGVAMLYPVFTIAVFLSFLHVYPCPYSSNLSTISFSQNQHLFCIH